MSEETKMWETLQCLPDAVEHMIHGDPDDADSVKASDAVKWSIAEIARLREERRSITTLLGKVETLEADNAKLREERRWIPVGERLPDGEEWVDVAGRRGDCLGWQDGEEWRNVEEDQFPSEVTHWRKRGPGPGPEANG